MSDKKIIPNNKCNEKCEEQNTLNYKTAENSRNSKAT